MQNIKLYRKRLKMTQQHLADLLVCDRTTISKWESGSSEPSKYMMSKIAEVLDCRVEDLIESKEVQK